MMKAKALLEYTFGTSTEERSFVPDGCAPILRHGWRNVKLEGESRATWMAAAIRHGWRNVEDSAACGCFDCSDGVQSGHFACSMPPTWALELEGIGAAFRSYDDGHWQWHRVSRDTLEGIVSTISWS